MISTLNKGQKVLFAVLTTLVVISLILVSITIFSDKNEVVASVNGKEITKEQLYDRLLKADAGATIDTLINESMIEQEAKEKDIQVSSKEIDEELKVLQNSYGGEEAFTQAITASGVSLDLVKDDIENYLQTKKLIEPRVKITEEEMKTFFEENKETYAQAEQVEASHILVEDEETAKEVKEKLDNGEDFVELAKEYSTDTANNQNGGELGFVTRGEMASEFEETAFNAEIDSVSNPVKTEHGYHIIKVTNKKEAKEATFEESKEEVEKTLFDQKLQSEYSVWLTELKEQYDIVNKIESSSAS